MLTTITINTMIVQLSTKINLLMLLGFLDLKSTFSLQTNLFHHLLISKNLDTKIMFFGSKEREKNHLHHQQSFILPRQICEPPKRPSSIQIDDDGYFSSDIERFEEGTKVVEVEGLLNFILDCRSWMMRSGRCEGVERNVRERNKRE